MIICLDFDGVIHSYTSGWQGATTIPDPPVPGALEWIRGCLNSQPDVELAIFSSRSRYPDGIEAMVRWLSKHGLESKYQYKLTFPTEKPPAFVTIADRAICFTGIFPPIEEVKAFRPWYQKKEK